MNKKIFGIFLSSALIINLIPIGLGFNIESNIKLIQSKNLKGWDVQILDTKESFSEYCSIDIDSNDRPHISYYAPLDLFYIYWDGNSWVDNKVSDPASNRVGYYNSIALDSNDRPHISYSNGFGYKLMYTQWSDTFWDVLLVDDGGEYDAGDYTSIAIDSLDKPHISYHQSYPEQLKYAYRNESGWHIQSLESGESNMCGYYTSLALDSNDRPHISYFKYSYIYYTFWDGDKWINQKITNESRYSRIALDSNNQPHIVFPYNGLHYVYWNGNSWVYQTIDTFLDPYGSSSSCSLILDAQDKAHIIYLSEGNVKYAYCDGNSWIIQYIESGENYDSNVEIALDSNDNPHVIYGKDGELKYATINNDPNHIPNKPTTPEGEKTVKFGKEYTYYTSTIDLDKDFLYYQWDWGDGNFSEFIGPFESGETVNESYIWGEVEDRVWYDIRVRAKDVNGGDSPWSDPLVVSMPKSKSFNNIPQIIIWLFERFPFLQPYLSFF